MKVLFLDIDGVLNSDETEIYSKHGNYIFIEDKYIRRLKRIVDATGCTLIMTAYQRRAYFSAENSTARKYLNEVLDKLSEFGLQVSDFVEDLKKVPLEEEIWGWLREHRDDIESYCVLDDHLDVSCSLKKRLVSPHMTKGLTEEEADACIRLLKLPLMEGDLIND